MLSFGQSSHFLTLLPPSTYKQQLLVLHKWSSVHKSSNGQVNSVQLFCLMFFQQPQTEIWLTVFLAPLFLTSLSTWQSLLAQAWDCPVSAKLYFPLVWKEVSSPWKLSPLWWMPNITDLSPSIFLPLPRSSVSLFLKSILINHTLKTKSSIPLYWHSQFSSSSQEKHNF